jgi:PAS domain S-box-containing protein
MTNPAELRKKAEKLCYERSRDSVAGLPPDTTDLISLIHELDVHHAELELQNEELKSTQLALQAAHDRMYHLFNQAPVSYLVLDTLGRVIEANHTFSEMTRIGRDALLGRAFFSFLSESAQKLFLLRFPALFKAPDGKQLELEFRESLINVSLSARKTQWMPDSGQQDALFVILHDITQQKKLETRLRESHKLEAIARLTGGIAHDFNNILASILGFTELAKAGLGSLQQDKLENYLTTIQDAGRRGRDLVQQILIFSRGDSIKHAVDQDLAPLVSQAMLILKAVLPTSIEVTMEIAQQLPPVHIYPLHLHQILMNLCINARDAMQGKGEMKISLSADRIEGEVCGICHREVKGEWIVLEVADNGPGIESQHQEKIFNPFFTTKDIGDGSGLGLSVLQGIVSSYGGHVLLRSTPGLGTSFRLLFSSVKTVAESARQMPKAAVTQGRGHGELILVVDDEPAITQFLSEYLILMGYRVHTCANGKQAAAFLDAHQDQVALLVTDQTMPGMGGVELVAHAKRLRADLPVILCTGFSDWVDQASAAEHGIDRYFQKPLLPEKLVQALQQLLAQNPC